MGHVLHDGTTASGPERIANLTASGDRSSFAADRAISRSQRPGPSGAGRRLSRLSGKVFLAVVRNRRSLQWVTGREAVVRAPSRRSGWRPDRWTWPSEGTRTDIRCRRWWVA